MTDQADYVDWARRFLDLWERNLVATADRPHARKVPMAVKSAGGVADRARPSESGITDPETSA